MTAMQFPKYGEPVGQAHMRQRMTAQPGRTVGADVWAHLPIATRQALASAALGLRGLDVYERGWQDIAPHDRIKIGAEARRIAGALL